MYRSSRRKYRQTIVPLIPLVKAALLALGPLLPDGDRLIDEIAPFAMTRVGSELTARCFGDVSSAGAVAKRISRVLAGKGMALPRHHFALEGTQAPSQTV